MRLVVLTPLNTSLSCSLSRMSPSKRDSERIVPHEVEEVWQHIQEMLDGGAIWPSQSPWCYAVVLV